MKQFIFFFLILSTYAESLHYSINWPSGLSLGEATLTSSRTAEKTGAHWDFALDIDASVPGFVIRDHYESTASKDLCGTHFEKKFTHGKKKAEEQITFDQDKHTATRETVGGATGEVSIGSCARDALTFIQFARTELAQGRLTPQQPVLLGASYDVRLEFTGTMTIKLGDQKAETDRVVATIKGPSSDLTIEIFFARDAARTPLMAKLPLALGTFSVELQR
jgi:hypothetical protein